ncbi:MAG: hypothetical protein G01um101420_395 [Parcubacteria group bacterium Gr01-1014_20]|nr:MAG: hypothetical protein G01um101420_395 [Parcubacteria group bacterium Gr01-1014_20]
MRDLMGLFVAWACIASGAFLNHYVLKLGQKVYLADLLVGAVFALLFAVFLAARRGWLGR